MSYYGQQPAPVTAYPPPQEGYTATATPQPPMGQAYMAPAQGNYAPPPPPGYPVYFDVGMNPAQPAQTQSRGDKAFLEGCCAALCCCCLLDMCF
uniref:Cysteine-rich transmembrane domain-containing protein n=1 Tax=Leersia perrieri TaxID=77586 RepID=A0A0D9X0G7_9ORYZ